MMIFENLTLLILSWLYFIHHNLFWLGLFSGAFLLAFDAEEDSKMKIFYAVLGIISGIPLGAYLLIPFLASFAETTVNTSMFFALAWVACAAFSWVAAVFWLRVGVRKFNVLASKLTVKTSLERNTRTDVRTIHEHIPTKALKFDPLKYLDKNKGVFLGKDEKDNPTYIEFGGGNSAPHIQVIGTTGAGKGVSMGVLASQFLERGEAVFLFDPKKDEYFPSVMYASAQRTGKPYHYIDLNRPNGPQLNLFDGATEDEAFELFQAGFALTEKGDASDFYGIADRREAGITAKIMARDGLTIAQVYEARQDVINDKENGAEKFFGKLREMAETPSINASSGGVSLEKVVQDGGCVYIAGSMRNDIVKTAMKILLVRIIQLAERRDRMAGEMRKICIVLDEVKYSLSRVALEAMGAARDKGVHLIVAHQSLGDLKDCSKDLNPDAVVDAIVENCRIKVCYKVQSPVTAEWLAAMSGKIQVDDETKHVRKNILKAEIVEGDRSIKQAERYLMDENMLLNLPALVCALYGAGLPKFVSIQPLKVAKSREAIRIVECKGGAIKSTADKLDALGDMDETAAPADLPMLDC